jgi:hypothetical protein
LKTPDIKHGLLPLPDTHNPLDTVTPPLDGPLIIALPRGHMRRQSGLGSPTLSSPKCRDTHACGVAQALHCCRCIVAILLLDGINATGIAVHIHSETIAHTKTQSRLCQSDKGRNCCCSWRCNCRDGGSSGGGGGEGAKGKMPERALRSHTQGIGVRSVIGAHRMVYNMRAELGRPTFGGGCR